MKLSLEDPSTNKDHMNTVLQEVDFVHSEVRKCAATVDVDYYLRLAFIAESFNTPKLLNDHYSQDLFHQPVISLYCLYCTTLSYLLSL